MASFFLLILSGLPHERRARGWLSNFPLLFRDEQKKLVPTCGSRTPAVSSSGVFEHLVLSSSPPLSPSPKASPPARKPPASATKHRSTSFPTSRSNFVVKKNSHQPCPERGGDEDGFQEADPGSRPRPRPEAHEGLEGHRPLH
jgi:hypothetical protein